MPKHRTSQSTLPEREAAICERLRLLRLGDRLKMELLAKGLGVTKNQWASYEYGRAPLRYGLGGAVCSFFNVSQRWLATGVLPKQLCVSLPTGVEATIDKKRLFSEVYDTFLQPFVEDFYERLTVERGLPAESLDADHSTHVSGMKFAGSEFRNQERREFEDDLAFQLTSIPDKLLHQYYRALLLAGAEFGRAHLAVVREHETRKLPQTTRSAKAAPKKVLSTDKGKTALTSIFNHLTTEAVKIPEGLWPKTLARLRRLLHRSGMKTRFARDLGVTRQTVHRWLNVKEAEPSGDLALRVQRWIELEEGKT